MSVAKARSERVLRFFIQQRLIRMENGEPTRTKEERTPPFRVAGGAERPELATYSGAKGDGGANL
jgi:hypothetical protein